jgi:two-component system sensor histidine kinase FlrB
MQRLSSLGKMVASLAHQIRTPLSAAMLYAANLTRKNLPESAAEQFAVKLNDRLKELESQVHDMLLFAKSGEEQVVSKISGQELLNAILPNAQSMTGQSAQRLNIEGFEDDISLTGNLTALQGAVLNLIHNASQVTPKGYDIHVRGHQVDGQLALSVCDAGPGVPETLQSKIFEPFFTTKTHGTGLGLSVVKSVVNAHNGKLTVTNLPSGGACFTLLLPCASKNTQPLNPQTNVA